MDIAATLNIPFSIVKKYRLPQLSFDLRLAWSVSLFLLIFLLAIYLFQVAEISKGSYLTLQQENSINDLSRKIEVLESDFLVRHSAKSIELLARSLGFEETREIHYLIVPGEGIAAK